MKPPLVVYVLTHARSFLRALLIPLCASSQNAPILFSNFLEAHQKLVGKFRVDKIMMNGNLIPLDHVMEVGQVIVISTSRHHDPAEELKPVNSDQVCEVFTHG